MKKELDAATAAAFEQMTKSAGIGAAVAAYYDYLGREYLEALLAPDLLDVYEESPDGSDSERDAAAVLRSRDLSGDDINGMFERAEKPKAFALILKVMAGKGLGTATDTIRRGIARFGDFLATAFGASDVAQDATMKLAWDATTVKDLIEVLKLTVRIPSSGAHGVVRQKLRQHSWDELYTNGVQITSISGDVHDELVLAAVERATTREQATALVTYTSPKSIARSAALAKARTLPPTAQGQS